MCFNFHYSYHFSPNKFVAVDSFNHTLEMSVTLPMIPAFADPLFYMQRYHTIFNLPYAMHTVHVTCALKKSYKCLGRALSAYSTGGPSYPAATWGSFASISFLNLLLRHTNTEEKKKKPFSLEPNQKFPPIFLNFPPFLYVFLYFRSKKIPSKCQNFPGNQVPEFPIFSRHVHKIMKLKTCIVGSEQYFLVCANTGYRTANYKSPIYYLTS